MPICATSRLFLWASWLLHLFLVTPVRRLSTVRRFSFGATGAGVTRFDTLWSIGFESSYTRICLRTAGYILQRSWCGNKYFVQEFCGRSIWLKEEGHFVALVWWDMRDRKRGCFIDRCVTYTTIPLPSALHIMVVEATFTDPCSLE